jgi:YVTN family beta-propeller protein
MGALCLGTIRVDRRQVPKRRVLPLATLPTHQMLTSRLSLTHFSRHPRLVRGLISMCAAVCLAACGGGGGADPAADVQGRKQALAAAPPAAAPADAHLKGMWGPVYAWPLIPIHTVLMPDGRVMSYGSRADGSSTAFFSVDVWDNTGDPDQGHLSFENGTGTDFFCSSQLLLPPASTSSAPKVFIAGGDIWTGSANSFVGNNRSTEFDANTNALLRGNDMVSPRWYSTSTTLANGEIYIQGGLGGRDTPEVRQLDGSFRQLTTADTSFLLWSYPRNYVMPDGSVFGYDFEGRMYFVRTEGSGRVDAKSILPLQYFGAGSSAMFRPGRILQIAGNTNAAAVIDVTSGTPVFTPTQSISSVRKLMTATLLADGQVLVTGGSPVWNELLGANKNAEIWNPTTGQWTLGAEGDRPRLYHSSALMLPDATVLVGGGGASAPIGADPAGERNVQVYYPPYLFTPAGTRAARPTIDSTPDWLEIGKTFSVRASGGTGGVSRVTLVKTGSVTHGYNLDQRFIELTFTRTATPSGSALAVNSPARPGEATPGYYMLFVFDGAGVPSQARILRMGVAGPTDTAAVPRLTAPGPLASLQNVAQNLQLAASDPNGDALVFSAAGLPPGVALNASTGLISGAPSVAGSYDVVVSVSDGTHSTGASFVWTVAAPTPLTLTLPPAPGASLSGGAALFAAGATGVGVQYSWNFGDGSAATEWSSQGTVSKVFSQPGTYVVTMSARDESGAVVSRSFLQTVYLGNGDKPSRASGNLAIETPLLGTDRLWVVNQDNNSITGFDTFTNQRLGEVAVGAGPRSIAVDAKGLLWVTNKFDATLSIVDPSSRSVLRTLALPRGSQPFGVAVSPVAAQAFVVLEGSGRLLRFDTDTFEQTGSLAVGAHARHVSVLGNGQAVYVTRFITPPMPGESTATVATPQQRGGEVIEVDVTSMTATRTIVLAHSDRPDGENQGSGVPNYLGAMAISPDGSQAYVPSKQDNIKRGALRNNAPLNFQNTVRAISSRIVVKGQGAGSEDLVRRVDHDNASLASAVAYDRRGVLMFVALETSREVAVVDAHSGAQVMRFDVGRAPQGLVVSADGFALYVHNFMDRTVGVYDLRPLLNQGLAQVPTLATLQTVATEQLPPAVLLGKQLFYDARDTRLARDSYMSCASCHSDGGHDGRVWDLTHTGEGLRNTISLRGRGGAQGRLHWSANFDEVQDFEVQIRALAGGSGLLSDAQLAVGTRAQPLGDSKAGISADLDALAAYVASLNTSAASPAREASGALTAAATAGKAVFAAQCASCHGGNDFTESSKQVLRNVGTQSAASGQRLGKALSGIDVPTLRDAWSTAPYLHNGAAATLEAAVQAHTGLNLSAADLANVVAYTQQIDGDEVSAPASEANLVVRAFSTLLDQVGALFDVRVNGAVVGSGQLDARAWVELLFDVATLVKDAVVEVVFKNNADSASEDRNLVVQAIEVNRSAPNGSAVVPATASGVLIDRGVGAQAFDGLDTVAAANTGGWMPWDSAVRFKLPALGSGDTVTVRGRATLAAGLGAQMELRVNGVLVGSRLISSTAVQDMVFNSPPIAPGDRIDVVFTNDFSNATEDRNLYVESITARGVVLPSTASGVAIDQGSGVAAFDGQGVVAAAPFGGWIPWNAAMRWVVP